MIKNAALQLADQHLGDDYEEAEKTMAAGILGVR
jgi:hypothetical protein